MIKKKLKCIDSPRYTIKLFFYSFSIVHQFYKGFKVFNYINPGVTFFGSTKIQSDNNYYIKARELARELALKKFTIITSAEKGIMEAANRGAKEGSGLSIGCNVAAVPEQKVNTYVDTYVCIQNGYVKKEIVRKYSRVFVFFPGGHDTLGEFFETMTLIKTKKIKNAIVILFGLYYYSNLINQMKKLMEEETIAKEEFKVFLITDDTNEAIKFIVTHIV